MRYSLIIVLEIGLAILCWKMGLSLPSLGGNSRIKTKKDNHLITYGFYNKISIEKSIQSFFVIVLLSFMVACNSMVGQDGVLFIAPAGKPPPDSIVWSPTDTNQVLVTATDLNHFDNQLYIYNTRLQTKKTLLKSDMGILSGNDWSPDGLNILYTFTSGKVDEKSKTLILNINENESSLLTEAAVGAAWSPDGNSVAFFTYGPKINDNLRRIDLHIMEIPSRDDRIIYTLESKATSKLSWSPDGRKLVFAKGDFNTRNIFVFDTVSQGLTQLTTVGLNNDPDWSPRDNNIIVYVNYSENGKPSLFLATDVEKCNYHIQKINNAWSPSWLPDGKSIGYVGQDGIFIVNLEKVIGNNFQKVICD
jgi:Tol biopolymer transport system component